MPPAAGQQAGQLAQEDEQEGAHERRGSAGHQQEEAGCADRQHAPREGGGAAVPQPGQRALQDAVEDAQVQARQGQDVGGARFAECRHGGSVESLAPPGQQGLQQGGGVGVREIRRVDGAEQAPEGPLRGCPGPRRRRRHRRGHPAEHAECPEQGQQDRDARTAPGGGHKQPAGREARPRTGPQKRIAPGRQQGRRHHSC